LFMDTTLYYN